MRRLMASRLTPRGGDGDAGSLRALAARVGTLLAIFASLLAGFPVSVGEANAQGEAARTPSDSLFPE